MYANGLSIYILDTYFDENVSFSGNGGAIYFLNSTASISRTAFLNNQANNWNGGAMFFDNCSVVVSECEFDNNSAGKAGQCIAFVGGANHSLTLTDNTGIDPVLDVEAAN